MSAANRIDTSRAGATRLTGVKTMAVSTRMYDSGERQAKAGGSDRDKEFEGLPEGQRPPPHGTRGVSLGCLCNPG